MTPDEREEELFLEMTYHEQNEYIRPMILVDRERAMRLLGARTEQNDHKRLREYDHDAKPDHGKAAAGDKE